MHELGGRRRPRANSTNLAWRNESFRGYADYMETDMFRAGMARLAEPGAGLRTAIMCSEAVWWSCHRSLIADYLKVKGTEVVHIMEAGKALIHPYTSPARIIAGEVSYSMFGSPPDEVTGPA
jgi:uncharacterized protein (DUF488 family)